MKLFIVGNGFDRAHGLKTSYWDFRDYFECHAEGFLTRFESLYGCYLYDPEEYHVPTDKCADALSQYKKSLYGILWKAFEESIGYPDEREFDSICDPAINEMAELESGPIGIGDTLYYMFEEQFGFVSELQAYLFAWVEQIDLSQAVIRSEEIEDSLSLFLTFNYTPILERVYRVPSGQICHIHGSIPPYCKTKPIIGHGNSASLLQWEKWKLESDEVFDEGGSSKCRAIANYYLSSNSFWYRRSGVRTFSWTLMP